MENMQLYKILQQNDSYYTVISAWVERVETRIKMSQRKVISLRLAVKRDSVMDTYHHEEFIVEPRLLRFCDI